MRILLLLLIPISCLAQKRLVPVDFDPNGEHETYSEISYNGLTVFAESFEVKKDLLVFDIEVVNESGQVISVSPEEIHYYRSDNPDQSVYTESTNSVYEYYERKIRKSKNTKSLLAILEAGLIIYDAISDGQDFRSEPTPKRVNKSIARDVGITASLVAMDIADQALTEKMIESDDDLYFLQEEILFAERLQPGASIRGKVYFNQNHSLDYYRLVIPIEDQDFIFDFRWPDKIERRVLMK